MAVNFLEEGLYVLHRILFVRKPLQIYPKKSNLSFNIMKLFLSAGISIIH